MKTYIIALILLVIFTGCLKDYHIEDAKANAIISTLPKSLGASFSNLQQQAGLSVSISLPLRYPNEWSEEKLKEEFLQYTRKYEGNVVYQKPLGDASRIRLNGTNAVNRSFWESYLLQQPKQNSFFHWEPNIAKEFSLDGSIRANYILQRKAFDLSGYSSKYFVFLVKDDRIIGYIWPYPARAGEVEYVQGKFGFFVY